MPTAKTENYTAEQTAEIVSRYVGAGTDTDEASHKARAAIVEELAIEFRGSKEGVRSIRAKLVTQDVYIARSKTSKVTGDKPEKKEAIAQRIVSAVGDVTIDGKVHRFNADSLAKANKTDLALMLHIFNSEIVDETETDAESETETPDESES